MYRLMRPLLFSIPAERSHSLALQALRAFGALPGPVLPAAGRPRKLMGLAFPNAVGLAAGLDKDAIAALGLARLGFGHLELGAVTPRPQPGNPRPRLFRLQAQQALINRMGFNNAGAAAMAARLGRLRASERLGETPIGVNIGKNRDTPVGKAAADYLECMDALHDCADYLTVNLSSPNTPGLRGLQQGPMLGDLLDALKERQAQLAQANARYVPLCVKLAPDLDEAAIEAIAEVLLRAQVDGVVATNTTLTRPDFPATPRPLTNAADKSEQQDQAKDGLVRQTQAADPCTLSEVKHGDEIGELSGAQLDPLARRTVPRLKPDQAEDAPVRQTQATDPSPAPQVKHGDEAGGPRGAPFAPPTRRTVPRLQQDQATSPYPPSRDQQRQEAQVRQAQATGTSPAPQVRHGNEAGGLSGAPLAPLAQRTVLRLRRRLGPEMPIIGVGGILSAADAAAMFKAGADLVQIYTGLIYQGPTLIRAIAALNGNDQAPSRTSLNAADGCAP